MPLKQCTLIRTYLPKEGHGNNHLLQDVITLLENAQPVGCVGHYAGVYELIDGVEGFSPLAGSNPTKGTPGHSETCLMQAFTTYADSKVSGEQIARFVESLASLHPWEHPVIEVVRHAEIWMPS